MNCQHCGKNIKNNTSPNPNPDECHLARVTCNSCGKRIWEIVGGKHEDNKPWSWGVDVFDLVDTNNHLISVMNIVEDDFPFMLVDKSHDRKTLVETIYEKIVNQEDVMPYLKSLNAVEIV